MRWPLQYLALAFVHTWVPFGPFGRGRVHSYPVAAVSTGVIAGCRSTSSIAEKRGKPLSQLRTLRCILPGNRHRRAPFLGCPVTGYDPTNLCLTSNCYILGSLPLMAAHLTRPEGRKLLVSYSSRTGHAGHNLLNHRHEPMLLFLIYDQ